MRLQEFGADGVKEGRPWAVNVRRIVLLAGMNRGWRISYHMNLKKLPVWWLGAGIGHLIWILTKRPPLIFTIRRGAEFITQLRIQWLFMRRRAGSPVYPAVATSPRWLGSALTIQLLGSKDDIVAPEDNVDLVSGSDFVYLDVPYSGHADVIELDDSKHGAGRKEAFSLALIGSKAKLEKAAIVPSDERFGAPDETVNKVVFVIHGSRDERYWTHKIARRVKQRAIDRYRQAVEQSRSASNTGAAIETVPAGPETWATETSSYGYFPMLPFLFPWTRRQKGEWLMDQYTEALARYPRATFSYVGHSNGTYLLARALELYPCCRFENVVFAGSVVRQSYDWTRFQNAKPPRIKKVLNFVATCDWVVAFFQKFFQVLRLQYLGSAGHDGFKITSTINAQGVNQVTYVRGGHGAAVEEPIWNVIADFVETGEVDLGAIPGTAKAQNLFVKSAGIFPPIVWGVIASFIMWIGYRIKMAVDANVGDPWSQGLATGLAFAAYALLLWMVLTRV